MATSSLFENIVISTPEEAEAFVNAIEASIIAQQNDTRPKPEIEFKYASPEDIIRLSNLRKQRREGQKNGDDR
ncbi:MAG: hypothetical protein II969_14755 [Anaerolineaceae bacterium]|nr:hypothetical protein [Anaerolineaceae bacterium]